MASSGSLLAVVTVMMALVETPSHNNCMEMSVLQCFVLQSSHCFYFFFSIEQLSRPQQGCPWCHTRGWITASHQELCDKECRTPGKVLEECYINGISLASSPPRQTIHNYQAKGRLWSFHLQGEKEVTKAPVKGTETVKSKSLPPKLQY